MTTSKKTERQPPKTTTDETPIPAAFSLRLPPSLRAGADRYADATGVSLNGLVCIALADYLAARGFQLRV